MPLASIHLIALKQCTPISAFLKAVKSTPLQILVVSKVIRWIITPESIDVNPLLHPSKPWDLLLITLANSPLPHPVIQHIECHWKTTAGIPSRLTQDFSAKNESLLHPSPASIPPLTTAPHNSHLASNSQNLQLSPGLNSWIDSFSQTPTGRNPMSMLNLLAFLPDQKSSYLKYGKAFAESIGIKRGGMAKLVGNIIDDSKSEDWDEFALAHYPSILHFRDMLGSEDYQAVNLRYRVPSLRDTCILCTCEIDVEKEVVEEGRRERKQGKL